MVRISIALRRRSEIFFDRVWERRFHFRAGPSILLLLFLHVQFTGILDQSLERKEMFFFFCELVTELKISLCLFSPNVDIKTLCIYKGYFRIILIKVRLFPSALNVRSLYNYKVANKILKIR